MQRLLLLYVVGVRVVGVRTSTGETAPLSYWCRTFIRGIDREGPSGRETPFHGKPKERLIAE